MIVVIIIHATAAVAATAGITARASVAAEIEQKEYDNENPNDIIIIKNIAKTIHKISSLRRVERRLHQSVNLNSEKQFAFPIC